MQTNLHSARHVGTDTEAKKIFGGILDNWFIHIDENNRFHVIGSNVLTDDFRAELSPPLLHIDTYYWLAETAEYFYLLSQKDTSADNCAKHYAQLAAAGINIKQMLKQ